MHLRGPFGPPLARRVHNICPKGQRASRPHITVFTVTFAPKGQRERSFTVTPSPYLMSLSPLRGPQYMPKGLSVPKGDGPKPTNIMWPKGATRCRLFPQSGTKRERRGKSNICPFQTKKRPTIYAQRALRPQRAFRERSRLCASHVVFSPSPKGTDQSRRPRILHL